MLERFTRGLSLIPIKIIVVITMSFGHWNYSIGQSTDQIIIPESAVEKATEEDDSEVFIRIKPLDTLIHLALVNSYELKSQGILIKNKEVNYKLKKRNWMNLLSVSGNYSYGSTSLLGENSVGGNTDYSLSIITSGLYNVGVGIRLSPGDFLNRGLEQEASRLEMEGTKVDLENLKKQLREEVIRRYSNLEIAIEMLRLKATNLEANRLSLKVAEQFYQEGNLPVSEYSTMLSRVASAEEQYINAKHTAKNAYLFLKEIVGAPIRD